eukprot:4817243-Pleurochrysis_carterae.AAC.1
MSKLSGSGAASEQQWLSSPPPKPRGECARLWLLLLRAKVKGDLLLCGLSLPLGLDLTKLESRQMNPSESHSWMV